MAFVTSQRAHLGNRCGGLSTMAWRSVLYFIPFFYLQISLTRRRDELCCVFFLFVSEIVFCGRKETVFPVEKLSNPSGLQELGSMISFRVAFITNLPKVSTLAPPPTPPPPQTNLCLQYFSVLLEKTNKQTKPSPTKREKRSRKKKEVMTRSCPVYCVYYSLLRGRIQPPNRRHPLP